MASSASIVSWYTKPLIGISLQVIFLSFLFTFYNVDVSLKPTIKWATENVLKIDIINELFCKLRTSTTKLISLIDIESSKKSIIGETYRSTGQTVFTRDQLSLFDGSRHSKPIYLALLGRVYNVNKGEKHYGVGGSYNIFAGKDATRAFVSGDFSPAGLTDDVEGLLESDILNIAEWISFYDKEYEHVGFLEGTYYDIEGKPTLRSQEVAEIIENARLWKIKRANQEEAFPSCNSEWKKGVGGRVWCSTKSGGIKREWAGVPRKLLIDQSGHRTAGACIKNFGSSSANPDIETNRGDLDSPLLKEYDGCPSDSNSCKILE